MSWLGETSSSGGVPGDDVHRGAAEPGDVGAVRMQSGDSSRTRMSAAMNASPGARIEVRREQRVVHVEERDRPGAGFRHCA
jgi:hypothetical protein